MKISTSRILFFPLILTVVCCSHKTVVSPEESETQKDRIDVHFSGLPGWDASDAQGKSSLCTAEDSVANLNVWCYLDGRLDAFSYNEEGGCSVRLYDGAEYCVFAIANTGPLTPPYLQTDAVNYKYEIPVSTADFPGRTLPMSTISPLTVNTGVAGGTVPLELSRMMARYNLKIRKTDGSVSRMKVSEVRVGNSPALCMAFGENSAGSDVSDGDCASGEDVNISGIPLYLVENIQTDTLDEEVCTFIEVRGRLTYEDRPTDASVYILDQDMIFRWYPRDSVSGKFGVRRNTEYTGTLSWSDFGWISDPEHVKVEKINEDAMHCITFCDKDGIPVSGAVFDNLDEQSIIDIHYRVYPEADSADVRVSTNVLPQSIHLSFVGNPVHVRSGIFRQRIANDINREMPADMVITLTNESKGISCSARLKLIGSGSCTQDWEEEDAQTVVF